MSLSSFLFWRKMRERQDIFAIISYVSNMAGSDANCDGDDNDNGDADTDDGDVSDGVN